MVYLGFVILIALVAGLAFLIVVNQPQKNSKSVKRRAHLDRARVSERWQKIEAIFSLAGPSNFKTAIMDADKLTDSVLIGLNVSGDSLGERLKNAQTKFHNKETYNNLWFAHKVRNNIAHEIDHEINSAEAKRAIEYYKKALKELGVI